MAVSQLCNFLYYFLRLLDKKNPSASSRLLDGLLRGKRRGSPTIAASKPATPNYDSTNGDPIVFPNPPSPPIPNLTASDASPVAPPKPLELEVTVVSGKHLKNVNWRRGDLRAYVVAYLDPSRRAATRPDDSGGCKPVWNERLVLPFPPHLSSHDPSLLLSLDVFHSKPSDSPKPLVGSSRSPLRQLLFPPNPNPNPESSSSPLMTLPLLRPSGRPHGKLRIRVALRDCSPPPPEPQYPPPSTSLYYFPPPPPPPSAYSAPPLYSSEQYYRAGGYYSAPPPQYEYTTGPSAPVEHSRQYEQGRRSGVGRGRYEVGTGLAVGEVSGALGGLAIDEGVKYKEEKVAEQAEEKVAAAGRDGYGEYRREY